jgi:hypothetical protein
MKITTQLFLIIILISCNPKTDDRSEIIKLLEKESATWQAGDMKGHADCWHIQPYTRILVSMPDGSMIDVPPAKVITPSNMGNGGVSVQTNYKMNISGNNAWVSHDEVSTSKSGQKSFSSEFRILEKINNEWKLVGQSIHVYKREG